MDSFVNIPGATTWKSPVTDYAALPLSGNRAGDARVTLDTSDIYIWDGSTWIVDGGGSFATASFTTFQTPSGTYPVADSISDTMTFTSSDSSVTITGNSSTDTIDFIVNPGGSNTQIQYNDSNNFGADANFTWNKTSKLQTITNSALAATTATSFLLTNTTVATTGTRAQVSPALQFHGTGWKTSSGGASQDIDFKEFVLPVQGTNNPFGIWKLQYSVNNAAYSEGLQYQTAKADGLTSYPYFKVNGLVQFTGNNSSTINTLSNLDFLNSTGTRIHQTYTFGSTIKGGKSIDNNGTTTFYTVGTSPSYFFNLGSSITSNTYIAQIYSNGIYCPYNGFFGQKVTAGSSDINALSSLNTYGSLSLKGTFITSSTYTLSSIETMVYTDPSGAEVCSGTPAACSTYANSTDCGNHSGVGCTWFAGNACSAFSGTDSGTCTANIGCTWDETTCQGANNTDQFTCESQDDSYGGNCSWDTGLCPSLGSDQTTCESQSGCTWNFSPCTNFNGQSQGTCEGNAGCTWTGADCHTFDAMSQSTCESGHTGCSWVGGDCHAFDGTDLATCETGHTGCTWDGALCNGTYDEGSVCNGTYDEDSTCAGQYDTSCTGNICTGTYATGNCSGVYGAECQGSASCGNLVTSGTCAAESGCTWVVGMTVTMPTTASANTGNTSRFYSIVQLTDGGSTTLVPNSGQSFLQYGSSLTLNKKGDRVTLHHTTSTTACSTYVTQLSCESFSGCTWIPELICNIYNDQISCEAVVGCSWNPGDSTCSGDTTAYCSGTHTVFSGWVPHNYEKSPAYVEKTANYTLTDIDDMVNCTSGTFTITLPSAATTAYQKEYTIKNTGTGAITLVTTSSQTIDGLASGVIILSQYDSITVRSTGTNWVRI